MPAAAKRASSPPPLPADTGPSPTPAPAQPKGPPGYPLADVPRGGCRFAVSPDAVARNGHRFCGAPSLPGKSWCAEHFDVVVSVKGTGGVSIAETRARAGARTPAVAAGAGR